MDSSPLFWVIGHGWDSYLQGPKVIIDWDLGHHHIHYAYWIHGFIGLGFWSNPFMRYLFHIFSMNRTLRGIIFRSWFSSRRDISSFFKRDLQVVRCWIVVVWQLLTDCSGPSSVCHLVWGGLALFRDDLLIFCANLFCWLFFVDHLSIGCFGSIHCLSKLFLWFFINYSGYISIEILYVLHNSSVFHELFQIYYKYFIMNIVFFKKKSVNQWMYLQN